MALRLRKIYMALVSETEGM